MYVFAKLKICLRHQSFRLERTGADVSRVHYIPALPHHKLCALHVVSDVILDSYPAGGCTTTREALELGKAARISLHGQIPHFVLKILCNLERADVETACFV